MPFLSRTTSCRLGECKETAWPLTCGTQLTMAEKRGAGSKIGSWQRCNTRQKSARTTEDEPLDAVRLHGFEARENAIIDRKTKSYGEVVMLWIALLSAIATAGTLFVLLL